MSASLQVCICAMIAVVQLFRSCLTVSPLPLRERKKAETWAALHEAAASLALEHGVDQTTVEAIAASAGVSPRTFFNYFEVKEDAIVGLREPVLEAAQLSRISVTADDLVGEVSRLLTTVAWTAIGGTDSARRRMLIARDPQPGPPPYELYGQGRDSRPPRGSPDCWPKTPHGPPASKVLRRRGGRADAGHGRRRPDPLRSHFRCLTTRSRESPRRPSNRH